MNIMTIVVDNLEKVGIGVVLFLGAYLSNVCLGASNPFGRYKVIIVSSFHKYKNIKN